MKPSDAKKLLPGVVLAVRGYGGAKRVVVESVRVHSPQKVFVSAKDRYDTREYDARDVAVPTAVDESAWAKQDADKAKREAFLAEKRRVTDVLGGRVIDKEAGYGSQITYFVQLTREQSLDIVSRLEKVNEQA